MQMHDLPGQTDLHSGISFQMNGVGYLAMGDSAHLRAGRLSHGHIIFANRVTATTHLKVAERMLEIEPAVLLPGHHRRELHQKLKKTVSTMASSSCMMSCPRNRLPRLYCIQNPDLRGKRG